MQKSQRCQCEWRITVADGERIRLRNNHLDIFESIECRTDYLEVRDGYWHKLVVSAVLSIQIIFCQLEIAWSSIMSQVVALPQSMSHFVKMGNVQNVVKRMWIKLLHSHHQNTTANQKFNYISVIGVYMPRKTVRFN